LGLYNADNVLLLLGALKSRDLTSRDLTTQHHIKQIATGWTSIGPRKIEHAER